MTTKHLSDPTSHRFASALSFSAFPDRESWASAARDGVAFYLDSVGRSDVFESLLDDVLRFGPHASLIQFLSRRTDDGGSDEELLVRLRTDLYSDLKTNRPKTYRIPIDSYGR